MFRVRWARVALNQLGAAWSQADAALRQRITMAAHRLDQPLRNDPLSRSESRPGGRRIRFTPPLGVIFRIEADGRTVSVLRVWVVRRRHRP
jgi:hypothetical protein